MRLQLPAVGRLATTPFLLAVAAGLAPSLAAQSPAGPAANYGAASYNEASYNEASYNEADYSEANYGVAGRALWGIAATAAKPQALPAPVLVSPAGRGPVVGGPVAGAGFVDDGGAGDSGKIPAWHAESCELGVVAGRLPMPYADAVRPAPFPYGYFGASGARHWQRHFGFRQAYTQWTLK